MKKVKLSLLSFAALILLLVLLAAGCSSGGSDNTGNSTSQSANQSSSQDSNQSANQNAKQEKITMRLGHVFAPESITDQASKRFAELVNQKTNGAIEIQVFPGGQLGGDEALGQNLSRGVLELAFLNQGSMAGMDPLLDFHYLPYIAENHEQVDKLYFEYQVSSAKVMM